MEKIIYILPIILIVISNVVYQICAKSVPNQMNPWASLTITYLVAAVISAILYVVFQKDGSLIKEYSHTNWAPFLLGMSIVGLEGGFIYAYKVGWSVSTVSTTQSAVLAVALIMVGFLLYQEAITVNKVIGIVICLIGLVFMNK